MPAAQDPRHQNRLRRVEELFSWQFYHENDFTEVSQSENQFADIEQLLPLVPEFDLLIMQYAPKHDIATFTKIDLAILRQALYELLYNETPAAVVIDEAVEIAKEYGSEETSSFVHGVLGNVVDDRKKKDEDESK